MLEVGRATGVPVELVVGEGVGSVIVMSTVLQRLSVKAIVSSVWSDKFTKCEAEAYSANPPDCNRSGQLGGAS